MGGRIKCFMLEPTDRFERSLRRFQFSSDSAKCSMSWGYHNASVVIDTIERPGFEYDGDGRHDWPHDDPRWPTHCECGYQFVDSDEWQVNTNRFYRSQDGTVDTPIRKAPPGAMWFSPFYDQLFVPQLEHCLVVMLPGGDHWIVDSQANNCTMQEDRRQEKHHCWVIRGTPPNLTVDKSAPTCAAGAGSIAAPGYHGFLRNGYLEEC